MSFLSKAFKKVTHAITKPFKSVFGGGGTTVVYQDEATAAPAAPAADSAESSINDQAYNAAKKRKKGKGSLYVSLSDNSTGGGGTGINV